MTHPRTARRSRRHQPGLGIDWDWQALERTIVHRNSHGAAPALKAGA
jgi:hypothetical protein